MQQIPAESGATLPFITAADFKTGMRRLASGVMIVATEVDGVRHGLASTAVTSISAEPPTLMVCVNRNASAHDALVTAGCYTVNVLGDEDQEVADQFGSSRNRERRFTGRDWIKLTTGAPALSSSLASFDCRIVEAVPSSSHTLFFGEVVDLRMFREEIRPLLYWNGAYHNEYA